ncbi:hypothetical protein T12_14145 [Trichinella patagoniensis]|uniref:Uncharacterized protein n=2 Tax=Trichinella TaxID=6333 RepID=A0A0V0ZN55_9BILA|nr:hypothetical protein T05_11120 [Trichinella murrelli]KRY14038.1 hypothetical protein T12_14145 [Trichinella patagoniensis]
MDVCFSFFYFSSSRFLLYLYQPLSLYLYNPRSRCLSLCLTHVFFFFFFDASQQSAFVPKQHACQLVRLLVHFRLEKLLLFFKKTNKQENKNTAQVLKADYTGQSRPLYGTCVNARGDCYTPRRPARRRLGYIGAREKEQKKEEAGASDAAGGSPAFTKTCNVIGPHSGRRTMTMFSHLIT